MGAVTVLVLTADVVPLLDATTSDEDVCAAVVVEQGVEAEVKARGPVLAAVVAVGWEAAGVVVLEVGSVKLGNELVVPEELVPVENPKPVNELVVVVVLAAAAAAEVAFPGVEVVELRAKPVKAGVDEVVVAATCVGVVVVEIGRAHV